MQNIDLRSPSLSLSLWTELGDQDGLLNFEKAQSLHAWLAGFSLRTSAGEHSVLKELASRAESFEKNFFVMGTWHNPSYATEIPMDPAEWDDFFAQHGSDFKDAWVWLSNPAIANGSHLPQELYLKLGTLLLSHGAEWIVSDESYSPFMLGSQIPAGSLRPLLNVACVSVWIGSEDVAQVKDTSAKAALFSASTACQEFFEKYPALSKTFKVFDKDSSLETRMPECLPQIFERKMNGTFRLQGFQELWLRNLRDMSYRLKSLEKKSLVKVKTWPLAGLSISIDFKPQVLKKLETEGLKFDLSPNTLGRVRLNFAQAPEIIKKVLEIFDKLEEENP